MSDYDDDYDDDDDDEVDGNLIDDNEADDDDDDDDAGGGDEYNTVEEPAPVAEAVLEYLTTQLVEDPDAVEIDVRESRGTIFLDVRVGEGDMGRVIGRRGRIAQAIRQVVSAAATHDDVRVSVEFVD